ncbi:MAG TPA: sigma 54-interacting transcriptional regulator [Candidatus Binataceae bacterium]|nr:sigma 54-interacting transcriptional regulator [Candidatus Binataceae bacterium]
MKPPSDELTPLPNPVPPAPRYFHLLWDEELDELRPVFEAIRSHRDEVLANWYNLYTLHFGDQRALTRTEFFAIFGLELDTTLRDLLTSDMEGFAADMRHIGRTLAERGVPFSELIVSMHLFEESATAVFPVSPLTMGKTYQTFDKLSHCRMIILADTYFRSTAAVSGARIQALEREARGLPAAQRTRFHGLIGANPMMRKLYERIEAVGATRGTVLVVGDSGTGKELVARAIHECGARRGAPFVALNCAAIPRDLIESELFGYKRGAFSGATNEYEGLFRAAEGGTLLLDEVTEMSAETQSKLLRVLQERTVRPVGATREIAVNARLIASTNRDPEAALHQGLLRQDLYYRLQASVLTIVPLRDRLDDVGLLVEHFIELLNERGLRPAPVAGIEAAALEAMTAYQWPGNVRELANAVETAFTFGRAPVLRLEDLPEAISGVRPAAPAPPGGDRVGSFAEAERDLIRRALESTGGNKVAAARMLKISRKKLYAKIAKYHLE